MLSDGTLKRSGYTGCWARGAGEVSSGCLPRDVFVNFGELKESFELSNGRFLGLYLEEARELAPSPAWCRVEVRDLVGEGGVK